MFEYLKKYIMIKNDEGNWVIQSNTPGVDAANSFSPLTKEEIDEAEKALGFPFPPQLRTFYEEIGYGRLNCPHNPPPGYTAGYENEILHPMVVARFYHGQLLNDDYHAYMCPDVPDDFNEGDMAFFHITDGSFYAVMRPFSLTPNAVYKWDVKIAQSLEEFIWKLYYESTSFYDQMVIDFYKSKESTQGT